MKLFSGQNANAAWAQAAKSLAAMPFSVASRDGATSEIVHAALAIADPKQRWITARCPAMNPAFALAEVIWIIAGRRDAEFLAYWNRQYLRFVGGESQLHGAYGFRLRSAFGIDQLRDGYEALRHRPESRQVVLQIWSSLLDLPGGEGEPKSGDIPCNLSSCLKVRDGRLHWLQTLRSNDIVLGVPHNVIQFTTLQEVFAGWLGLDVGEYVQVSDSLHLYERDRPSLRIDETTAPAENTDRFREDFERSAVLFRQASDCAERLTKGELALWNGVVALLPELPGNFQNLLRPLVAEAARRQGREHDAELVMADCDNPALRQLWERWLVRLSSKAVIQ